MMTTIYLIRHAQAMGNLEGRSQGSTDSPLSSIGLEQLDHLARRCRDIPATHIYASPLIRARQTAEAVNRHLNLPLSLVPDLREIHMGDWEGRLITEIEEKWPEERRLWREERWRFTAPGGESMVQVYDRMRAALTQIAESHPGETVFAVSHGTAIIAARAWAMGGIETLTPNTIPRNTALSALEIDNGKARLVFHNDFAHLPPQLHT